MNFVHGWFLSPRSNSPTQSSIANDSLPKKSGHGFFAKATQSKNGNKWSSINLLMAQFSCGLITSLKKHAATISLLRLC
jgi:hypothetical protein